MSARLGSRPVVHVIAVLAAVATYDVMRSAAIPDRWHFGTNVGFAAALLGASVAAGYRPPALGLARGDVASGVRWGVGAMAVIGGALAVAAAVPASRGWFVDSRVEAGAGEVLVRALVTIPFGTAAMEEVIFRSVLLATSLAAFGTTAAVLLGSIAFGLWHIPPIVGDGSAAIAGTVAATTIAGVAFIGLRMVSRSVIAPTLAHIGTNSGAFLAAWAVR